MYRRRYALFIDGDVIPLAEIYSLSTLKLHFELKIDHVSDIWLKIWDHITDSL